MKISRFNQFIGESKSSTHTQDYDTFKYIFMDLIDEGFELTVDNVYFFDKPGGSRNEHANQSHKKPGYEIRIRKDKPTDEDDEYDVENILDFELAKKVMSIIEECSDRLSEYGDYIIDDISFDRNRFIIDYFVVDKESKEADVNVSEGFDMFMSMINRKWQQSHNKLTKGFNFERVKDGIVLSPNDGSVSAKSLFSTAKTFISNALRRKYYRGGGPNWLFKYDIELKDGKIHITFKERIDETPEHARRRNDDE